MADDKDKVILEVGLDHSPIRRGLDAVARQSKHFWTNATKGAKGYGKYVHQVSEINPIKMMSASRRKVGQLWTNATKGVRQYGSAMKESFDASYMSKSISKVIKDRQGLDKEVQNSIMSIHEEAAAIREVTKAHKEKQKEYETHIKRMSKQHASMSADGSSKEDLDALKKRIEMVKRAKELSAKGHKKQYGPVQDKIHNGLFVVPSGGKGKGGGDGFSKGLADSMKGIGAAIKPFVGMFAKLQPFLSIFMTGFQGLVQLLIDAESAAKDMNRQMLQASGTSAFWSRNMERGGVALLDMGETLGKIRNEATSLSNLSWGINKEDHMAVLSSLAAEGVSYKQLEEQMASAQGHAKSFGGAVQVAVAYSRQFGVSLQELSQFQGELMRETGASVDVVEKQFSQMAREANESGIASNKFFAIIRGVSADLNLYNNRIEDAVKLLGRLGKVMNPREAGKFMGTLMKGFKDKSRTDLVQMNLLNGGKGGEYMKDDLARRARNLAEQIGGGVTAEDLMGKKPVSEILKNVSKEQQGTVRSSISDLRQDSSMNKKGLFGSSMSMSNASPAVAAQMLEDAAMRFTNGKTNADGSKKRLVDARGELGVEMMMDKLGVSLEEMSSRVKFADSLNDQRDTLKEDLKEDPKSAKYQAVQLKLERAGIKLTGNVAKDQQAVDAANYAQIMDTLDKSAQDELTKSNEVIDYNKRTSEYTSKIEDKIGVLVDFVMNQIYNVMMNIWDVLTDIFDFLPGAGEEKKRIKFEHDIAKTKNRDLIDAAQKANGNQDQFKGNLLTSGAWQKLTDIINMTPESDGDKTRQDAVYKSIQSNMSSDDLWSAAKMAGLDDKIQAKAAVTPKEEEEIRKKLQTKTANEAFTKGASEEQANKYAADYMQSNDGRNELSAKVKERQQEKEAKFKDNMRESLGDEDYKKLILKSGWAKDPKELAKFFMDAQKASNTTSSPQDAVAPRAEVKSESKSPANTPSAPVKSESTPALPPKPESLPPGPNSNAPATPVEVKPPPGPAPPPPMTERQGDESLATMSAMQRTLAQKGIKIDPNFLRDKFWSQGKDAVLEANRESLFEYFMYSKLDPEVVAKGLKEGTITPQTIGPDAVAAATADGAAPELDPLKGFASGGVIPQPKSPDSVFVAARPGETILPKGAQQGTTTITIPLTVSAGPQGAELADMIRAGAINTIYEWQRKNKSR